MVGAASSQWSVAAGISSALSAELHSVLA
jgi:hypothetical protein